MIRFWRLALLALLATYSGLLVFQLAGSGDTWLTSWQRELGGAFVLLFAAWSLGRRLSSRFCPDLDEAVGFHIDLALGLGLLTASTFLLGQLGMLNRFLLVGLVVGVALWGLYDIFHRRPAIPDVTGWHFLLLLPLIPGFIYATLPPIFYDAIVYHLGLPNLHLASGRLVHPDGFCLAAYPQNAELINLLAMALAGERAAQLTNFFLVVCCAFALRSFARQHYSVVAANLAYLTLLGTWFFWFEACFCKNDLLGAYFLLVAVWVLLDCRPAWNRRSILISGILAGLAIGIKFTNMLPVMLLGALLPFTEMKPWRARLRSTVIWLSLAVVVASPWMIRNVVHRGNPIFPAFYSLLGGHGWQDDNAMRMARETGMVTNRSPAAVAYRIAQIGWLDAPYGSGGEVLAGMLPVLLLGVALTRERRYRLLLLVALLTLSIGVGLLSAYLRIWAFALLLIPLAVASIHQRFDAAWPRRLVATVFSLAAAYGFADAMNRLEMVSGQGSRVVRGLISPKQYLSNFVNYYPLACYINEHLPADSRILIVGSARSTYIDRRCAANYVWDDQFITRTIPSEVDHQQLIAELRSEGFTHILLDPGGLRHLEAAYGIFGISDHNTARQRVTLFFRALPLEHEQQGCLLFALGSDPR